MLREGWNFHNDIAVPLEHNACAIYGESGRPVDKIYDADAIEAGNFAEVMLLLLRAKSDYSSDRTDIDAFVNLRSTQRRSFMLYIP